MSVDEFKELLKRFASTIQVTKDEHKEITKFTKNTDIVNFRVYKKVGVKVKGLSNITKGIPRII